MKRKNIIITAITVLLIVIALTILIVRSLGLHFNVITYHTERDGDYAFSFKGSQKTVREVVIKKNSKKLCTLPFNAASSVFSDDYTARWEDINFDGVDDVLLVSAIDADDNDIHYTAFIYDSSANTFIAKDALADLPNIKIDTDAKCLYTSYTYKELLEDPAPNTPESYERKQAIVRYEYKDGEPIAMEERAITFYSDTYYYCYSIYKYSEKYGELTYFDEKWFHPDKLADYPLSFD